MSNKIELQYLETLRDVLENGYTKTDRTGVGTKSLFSKELTHHFEDGFPLLTTKHVSLKTVFTELKWFLLGRTDLKWLLERNCKIWVGDCYNFYLKHQDKNGIHSLSEEEFVQKIMTDFEFEQNWGDLGLIYGFQWRRSMNVDQIGNLIETIKNNPDSRRQVVSAWNIAELEHMLLPPCHYSFQTYVHDGYLDLKFNMRSSDLPLGLPFNIASYGMLLLMLCDMTKTKPHKLVASLGDYHIYTNQFEGVEELLKRTPYNLPTLKLKECDYEDISDYEWEDFELIGYKHHPKLYIPLSN